MPPSAAPHPLTPGPGPRPGPRALSPLPDAQERSRRPRRYNNKTYRVDDIDWDQNPNSTFKKADGSEVSFLEYYRKVRARRLLPNTDPPPPTSPLTSPRH